MKIILSTLAGLMFLFLGNMAHASCPAVNPNNNAPPFVDGCDVPAIALNRLASLSNLVLVPSTAKCDGSTDDTAAIQASITSATTNHQVAGFPAGTCLFSSTITAVPANNWGIVGSGPGTTTFKYTGGTTNANLFTLGSLANPSTGVVLASFRVVSSTTLTAGDAIYIGRFQESVVENVYADDQFGSPGKNLWNGFDFDSINHVILDHAMAYAQNDCLRAFSAAGTFVDLYVDNYRFGGGTGCTVGVHAGGGVGGLYLGHGSALLNGTNTLIDNGLSTATNVQQVRLEEASLMDTATNDGVKINQSVSGGNYQFTFDGWISASGKNGIEVVSCPGCKINISGHPIQFNGVTGPPGDGIRLSDATANYTIGGAIYNNSFNGINCTSSIVVHVNDYPHDNLSGGQDITSNCSVLNNSITSCISAAPTGTTSTTGVMVGLACPLAVRLSNAVRFTVSGQMSNNTASDGGNVQLRYGTGTAPVNGAALTGTAVGLGVGYLPPTGTSGMLSPFSQNFVVTGLTSGLNYWYDISEAAGIGGTVSLANVQITAQEIK